MKVKIQGKNVVDKEYDVFFKKYDNNRTAIILKDEGYPYATASVNLPDDELGDDEIFMKTWCDLHKDIVDSLELAGIIVDTNRKVKTGFVDASVYKLIKTS